MPPEPVADDAIAASRSTTSTATRRCKPVFYELDAPKWTRTGQQVLQANADVLQEVPDVADHRRGPLRRARHGRVQPGARRAPRRAARNYLVSLGIPADRVKTVSYGKEFPFDPGHDEGAWSKNRRAHFVVTAK